MTYTQDQTQALNNMLKWVKNPLKTTNDLLYVLDGAAGTGKTTIVRAFINKLDYKKSQIAVTAPTHKAKKVIADATGFNAETIQKLLGLRPNVQMDNFNINRPVFAPMAKDELQYYKIVLVDESSMINKAAFELIIKKAAKYKTRIIFIGDSYQLPPIKELISKVFINVKNKSTLRQIVRQSDENPLASVLLNLREDVKKGISTGIETMINEGTKMLGELGYKCLGSFDFSTELLNMYRSTEYQHNKDYIKFLTYTNPNLEDWSEALRKYLLKDKAKNLINVGETLTGYTTIADYRTQRVKLQNSEDYIVQSVTTATSKHDIKGYKVVLKGDTNTTEVFIVSRDDIEKFKEVFKQKHTQAMKFKGGYWKAYYNFKHAHLLMNRLYKDDTLPPHLINNYKNLLVDKDIYYGYGCTIHKSQGSTYDNVAINLKNIFIQNKIHERARLIYVALSRTSKMNLILTQK